MNVVDFIFQLLHIRNLPTLFVLIPLRSSCTPSVDYAHLFGDYENTFNDYIDFSIDCAHNSNDNANIIDDCANTTIDSVDTPNISSLDLCIPNLALL
jgi:hypothetical protein